MKAFKCGKTKEITASNHSRGTGGKAGRGSNPVNDLLELQPRE